MTSPVAPDPVAPDPVAPDLAELAAAYGVATEFEDWQGKTQPVSERTVRGVLAALEVDSSSPAAVRRATEEIRMRDWRRGLPPATVLRQDRPATVPVVLAAESSAALSLVLEAGSRRRLDVVGATDTRDVDGHQLVRTLVQLPADLPLGWHSVVLETADAEPVQGRLIVTPGRLELPAAPGGGRQWGFWLQLYALRSRNSWGMGDLADLADLAEWSAAELGAGFVLVNPLHAAEPRPPISPSPYLPMSRRFASPLYLRIEDIPEFAKLGAAERTEIDRLRGECMARNTTDDLLDRDLVWRAKRAALEQLFDVQRGPEREAAFTAYREREGQGLVDFATWCALADTHGLPWRSWPAELHDPRSAEVATARAEHAPAVMFWSWVQWVLDEQFAATRARADAAGMAVGVLHDLAVGVSADGADAWALQDVLALGVSVGAPPDAFNQQGQDWAQPPWRPDRLAQAGYEPYRVLLQTLLRHSGGLRIDHILGMFRSWWVPEGLGPGEGTYLRNDSDALIGILALEAQRAGALVVGEDLGNVGPGIRDSLSERGILGTSLLWFERDKDGQPTPPEQWRELSLATVTTHDLPPTAGYLAGVHVGLRADLGLLTRDVSEEQAAHESDLAEWRELLDRYELRDAADAGQRDDVVALHRLLALTPARLLGVGLPDAAGDARVINQPGTSDEYPNWRLPLADANGKPVLLEDLKTAALPRLLADTVRGED